MSGAGRAAAARWRVLHVLATSIPYANGYTYRSKYIVSTQRDDDRYESVSVVTSPFYPESDLPSDDEVIDGVSYHRIPHPIDRPPSRRGIAGRLCVWLYRCRCWRTSNASSKSTVQGYQGPSENGPARRSWFPRRCAGWVWRSVVRPVLHLLEDNILLYIFRRDLDALVKRLGPNILHAHSPYRCALPAEAVGRKYRIPCVYEVRGLWEESSVASGRWTPRSPEYQRWRAKDTRAMRRADAAICICQELREELIARGVPAERISVVPNAASSDMFRADNGQDQPAEVARLRERLGPLVLGYIGSLRPLEGVDELIHATADVRRRGYDVSLLIVGDGVSRPRLQALADEVGLGDRAIFTGRVAHEVVAHYYSLISAFVVSRPSTPVTETVTPLKPLEAMAMERPIVVSDLAALRELVQDEQTGLLYPAGDQAALAAQCIRILDHPDEARQRVRKARQWLSEHRTWQHVMQPVPELYAMAHNVRQGCKN
ncbi:MAG: glycosyltransferase family 4 protein [Planctomycetota bacterium]|jgi:glycosyltransferase involved in cell wall biosynthesis